MITALPSPPSRSDVPATFITKADALLGALPLFVTETNAVSVALTLNSTNDTSTSSVAIGTGTKTFTVTAGKSFQPGMYLVIADTAAPSTNSMFGQITSYSGTSLVMNIISVRGSGTKTAWVISQSSAGSAQAGANTDITSLASPAVADATANTQALGDNSTKVATTAYVDRAAGSKIQPILASVASSALTVSASLLTLDFRSSTLASGAVTTLSGTPSNLVISSGSTLGTVSAVQSRIVVIALNNAGTIELAAVNISGGNDLTETGVISTTAEGGAGAAGSANVIYSTTARTNVAYRVIGYIESTQATAGTWATAPSTIQGYGGQALAAMSSFGYGQTPQNMTGSRSAATTYYNTTGRTIEVHVSATGTTVGSFYVTPTVAGMVYPDNGPYEVGAGYINHYSFAVPPGASYRVALISCNITRWVELR